MGIQTVYRNSIEKFGEFLNESPVSEINPTYFALAAITTFGVVVTFAFVQKYFFPLPYPRAIAIPFSSDVSYNNIDSLIIAAKEGNISLIKRYLEAGIEIDKEGNNGRTPLTEACKAGKWTAAKLLIEGGASVNKANCHSQTALHFAVAANNVDMVRFLFQHQAAADAQDENGKTPLHSVCEGTNAKKELLELLFANTKVLADNDGNTPLHLACKGNKIAVQFLLDKVDLDAKNSEGQTPCHIAAKANRSDILEVLVSNKANPNLQDNEGNIPLHDTVLDGCTEAMITLLKVPKINPNILNKRGESPLHLSIYKLHGMNDGLALQLLQSKNVDTNQPINQPNIMTDEEMILQGMTPAHLAVHFGHFDILQALVKKQVQLDRVDNDGNTPLLLSMKTDKILATELLIKNMSEQSLQSLTKEGLLYAEEAAVRFDETTLKLLAQRKILFIYHEENKGRLTLAAMKNFFRHLDTMFKKYPAVNIEELQKCKEEIDNATTMKNLSPSLLEFAEEIALKLKYFAKFSEEAAQGRRYSIVKDLSLLLQCFQCTQIEYVKPLYLKLLSLPIPMIPSRIIDAIKQIKMNSVDELFAMACKISMIGLAGREHEREVLQNAARDAREMVPLHFT